MSSISVYELASGRILKTCHGPVGFESDLTLPTGQAFVVGYYPDDEYYVTDGVPVGIPARPSADHTFDYATKQWVDLRTAEEQLQLVRFQRDRQLQKTDWTQLPDVPLATKEAWATYRQALRDITLQPDPFNITWPTPPG